MSDTNVTCFSLKIYFPPATASPGTLILVSGHQAIGIVGYADGRYLYPQLPEHEDCNDYQIKKNYSPLLLPASLRFLLKF